eukprot:COSAG01_NODE_985_length_12329_cov_363.217171_4_plen_62_part_00
MSGLDFLSYLEQEIFTPLGMASAGFGEDAQANHNVLKLYAYGPSGAQALAHACMHNMLTLW